MINKLVTSTVSPLFGIASNMDHKPVTNIVNSVETDGQRLGYWNLNAFFPVRKYFRNQISELIKQELTDAITTTRI